MSTLLAQAILSLENPYNPKYCCNYYICLLSHVDPCYHTGLWEDPVQADPPYATNSYSNLNLERLVSSESRAIVTAVSKFLTTTRSREEMAGLALRMEKCDCDRTDPLVDQMHAWQWKTNAYNRDPPGFTCRTNSLEGLLAIMAEVVYNALQLSELEDNPLRHWPQSVRDCLAGDFETSATMLCRWLDAYPILPLLRVIAGVCSRYGEPAITPFLLSAHLPKNIVAILRRGMDSIPNDFEGEISPFGIVYPITLCFIVMRELNTRIVDGVSTAYFYREQCPLLLETLTRVAYLNEKMTWMMDFTWELGFDIGGVVHAKLVLPYDATLYHPTILQYSKKYRLTILAPLPPYQLAYNIMRTITEYPADCMNLKCTSAAGASMMCSGCKRVAYCDAQCQLAAWNGQNPHKPVCKQIRALGDAAGFPIYANPKSPPPDMTGDEFGRLVQANSGMGIQQVRAFNMKMIDDDRIRRVLNDKYSARYERLLE
ncbi:hypothetical protein R3P38DRAFT_1654297 [Favolaschia claudopus]|uniref:MYND-type domain-containing protein n=1 Tax=Favolaschia claudopus TaxID=2862362 RepID=A0AAW0DJT0_9AGAR